MKRRTLRGQFEEGTNKRLVVDDGRLNHGYKVVSFVVAASPSSSGNDVYATLSLDLDTAKEWDWGDNRQIAWASTDANTGVTIAPPFSVIDPDHVVIQDLFIQGQFGSAGGTSKINYLIELEPVSLTDDQAIITLIKERSQDDL